jgi:hypothetical protein
VLQLKLPKAQLGASEIQKEVKTIRKTASRLASKAPHVESRRDRCARTNHMARSCRPGGSATTMNVRQVMQGHLRSLFPRLVVGGPGLRGLWAAE